MIAIRGPLAPVREALLRRARADAERWVADADDEAAKVLAEARAEADQRIAEAGAAGRADADALASAELARARRTARGIVHEAQREAYDELRRRVAAALVREVSSPRLRAALIARGAAALDGPSATDPVRVVDLPGGGVAVERGSRRVDCGVEALADHAVSVLAGQLPGLWDG
jgi:vacuolar-type H+-ATPase subunit E/Vma4